MSNQQPVTALKLTEAECFVLLQLDIRTGCNLYTISDEQQYAADDATHANDLLEECHLHRERLQQAVQLGLLPAVCVPPILTLILPELEQFEELPLIRCTDGFTILGPTAITQAEQGQDLAALIEHHGGLDQFTELNTSSEYWRFTQ